jgi:hypothetical protein
MLTAVSLAIHIGATGLPGDRSSSWWVHCMEAHMPSTTGQGAVGVLLVVACTAGSRNSAIDIQLGGVWRLVETEAITSNDERKWVRR